MAVPENLSPQPGAPPPATNRGRSSLRRKALAAGAAGLLALGVWLGTMFDGFGFGTGFGLGQSGDGVGSGAGDGTGTSRDTGEVSTDGITAHIGNAPALGSSGTAAAGTQPVQTLAVLVKGDGYQLPREPGAEVSALSLPASQHFQPATLDEVVAQARETKGNASGIRVLIYRHKSSTVGLHGTLVHALQDAGIPNGGVHVVTGFVD